MLLRRIQYPHEAYPETVTFEPELMVRESTGAARLLPKLQAVATPRRRRISRPKATKI
jgi:hypothetical protein